MWLFAWVSCAETPKQPPPPVHVPSLDPRTVQVGAMPPGGQVLLDDVILTVLNEKIILRPGSYTLEFRAEGFLVKHIDCTVSLGSPVKGLIDCSPEWTQLSEVVVSDPLSSVHRQLVRVMITSNPLGLDIVVDGKPAIVAGRPAKTPIALSLTQGEHTLEGIGLDGSSLLKEVVIKANEDQPINLGYLR